MRSAAHGTVPGAQVQVGGDLAVSRDGMAASQNDLYRGELIALPIRRRRENDRLEILSTREREVLELIGEGLSNQAIAERLFVSQSAVEKHVSSIFDKLQLPGTKDTHRRVLAVLALLRH